MLIVPSVSFISGENGVLLEATAGQVDAPGFIERINAAAKVSSLICFGRSIRYGMPGRKQVDLLVLFRVLFVHI